MKKQILSLLLLLFATGLSAQETKFYAIDGSEWNSESLRDKNETLLLDKLLLNFKYMEDTELASIYSRKAPIYQVFMKEAREINNRMKKVVEDTGLEYLSNKLNFKETLANNNEILYDRALKDIFNLVLEDYRMLSDYANDVANFSQKKSDKIPQMDLARMEENINKFKTLGEKWNKRIKQFEKATQEYESGAMGLEIIAYKIENTRKGICYAFDGKQYKTLKGRDNYEQRIAEKYSEILDRAKSEIEGASRLEELVLDNLDLLKQVRIFNSLVSLLEDETKKEKAMKEFPSKDFTQYTARNGEVCYIKDIYDFYESLLGLFEIYDGTLKYVDETNKKNMKLRSEGKEAAKIAISLTLEEAKDSQNTAYMELMDRAGSAAENLSPFFNNLIKSLWVLNK